MGYDMHWVRKAEGEEEAYEQASAIFEAACAARESLPREEAGQFNLDRAEEIGDWDAHEAFDGRTDRFRAAQDTVTTAYAALMAAYKSYFRLNNSGMGAYVELMAKFEMAFDDIPHPQFPDVDTYGITDDQGYAVKYPEDYPETLATLTPEEFAQANAYVAETTRVLAWHGKTDTPGIPFHKFSTNDGWIVLPVECEAAVKAWEAVVKGHGEETAIEMVAVTEKGHTDYWLAWIEWLRGAAKHGGFTVN